MTIEYAKQQLSSLLQTAPVYTVSQSEPESVLPDDNDTGTAFRRSVSNSV